MTEERRRFQRITFDATCEVRGANTSWPVQLVDISFQGALTDNIEDADLNIGDQLDLVINLADDVVIDMPVVLKHKLKSYLGFQAQSMDIDSMSHLRRLVELNLGDQTLLERELEHLVEQ